MKNITRLVNNAGISMVEVLVVIGLLALVSLGTAQIVANLAANTAQLDSKNSVNGLVHSLQTYLATPNVCTNSLVGSMTITAGNVTVPLQLNIPGVGLLAAGQLNPAFNIMIEKLAVESPALAETNALGMQVFVATLKVTASQFTVHQQLAKGVAFKERTIGAISLVTTSTGALLRCGLDKLTLEIPSPTTPTPGGGLDSLTISGGGGGPVIPPATTACTSIEQCAVYDWFLRNGIANPIAAADTWMASNANWTTIAGAYVGQMNAISQMNLLSNVYQQGLVQTGLNGANTIDQWVLNAVSNDSTGLSMLRTQDGLELLASMFPSTAGASVPSGTLATAATQEVLRDLLIASPEVTMNSSLGIGTWVQALGLASQADFIANYTTAAVGSASSPNAVQTAGAVQAVRDYIAANPADAIAIARGTGLWAANVPGGVTSVTDFIVGSIATNGSPAQSMALARATDTWATNYTGGVQSVANFIQNNSAQAAQIAAGTVIATDIFGGAKVAQTIMENPSMSAQLAQDLDTFQRQSGWSTERMAGYANDPAHNLPPDGTATNVSETWQYQLENAVRPTGP